MLPYEIDPFADHHIEKLEEVNALLTLIELLIESPSDTITVTKEDLAQAKNKVLSATNGFVRFKVCMADEVRQKILYRDRWLAIRPKL